MKTESPLTICARALRAAKAAGAVPPVMPCTTLKRGAAKPKRRKVREVIVEVEKKPLHIKVSDLRPHPLLGRAGLLPDIIKAYSESGRKSGEKRVDHKERAEENAIEFAALVESILEHGVKEKLKVVREAGGWAIADGRHRWEACREIASTCYADPRREAAARRLEATGIPCEEIQQAEVPAVILAGITRRHLSKQARALLALKVFPEVAEEAKRGTQMESGSPFRTQAAMASRIGVSHGTLKDACEFWREIALLKKSDREAAINAAFAGISFANIKEGLLGKAATKGQPRAATRAGILLWESAKCMIRNFSAYDAVAREDQLCFLESLTEAMRLAPAEVKTTILTALQS